ncbi:hypothetical protein NC77_22000 [Janthinobacterium lividum]|uniref:sialidase family protein n=1 Tax=Janthinobacterium lividum TaxID=29581 RepID=UPI000538FDFC|nr:sialidase family protein [Janthinobacterium lividum]KHA76783.1 hypothetical protein NC77_22000 [Janthinobacterium lividum]
MMRIPFAGVLLSALLALPAYAQLDTLHSTKESVIGGGRTVMRMADGALVATFARAADNGRELAYASSQDNGKTWQTTTVFAADRNGVSHSAIDSNFQGSYIAFVSTSNKQNVARVAYTTDPLSTQRTFSVSDSLMPEDTAPVDGFIQASRAGWGEKADKNAETVAYGWQDARSKNLYVGISPDGKTFPKARKILADPHATSGPSVGIRGQYVIVTYLTTDPAIVPSDVKAAGRSYQAWIESRDGGNSWTKPQPLFGPTSASYPSIDVTTVLPAKKASIQQARLSGGTNGRQAGILVWQATPAGTDAGIVFVLSELSTSPASNQYVGVVSFRPLTPGATWTHSIAGHPLVLGNAKAIEAYAKPSNRHFALQNAATRQFQYSALVDTPVRSASYLETSKAMGTRLTVATSKDTGKTFDQVRSFSVAELQKFGLKDFGPDTVFKTSQCLFQDRDGQVYVDVLAHSLKGELQYARLPVGANAQTIQASEAKGQRVAAN